MLVLRVKVTAQSLYEPSGPRGGRARHLNRFRSQLISLCNHQRFILCHIHRHDFQLVVQVPRPTVRYSCGDQGTWFSSLSQFGSQMPPARIVTGNPVGQLDQCRAQLRVGSHDQPGIGLPVSAGGIAWRKPAKTRKLFAIGKVVEPTYLGTQRPGGHWTHSLDG